MEDNLVKCKDCGIIYKVCDDHKCDVKVLFGYQNGRQDAIDELKPFVHINCKGKKFLFICAEDFDNLSFVKQLKENMNEV